MGRAPILTGRRVFLLGVVALVIVSTAALASAAGSPGVSVFGKPEPSSPPVITGNAVVGTTLTSTTGVWRGLTPMTFSFQWSRCLSPSTNCSTISGATASSYQAATADVGDVLMVTVTARNVAGQGIAN